MDLEVSIGVPDEPLPEKITEKIAEAIRDFHDIAFAFLPEMFIPGQMENPAPVLVIVTKQKGPKLEKLLATLRNRINGIMPDDMELDLLPIPPEHELVMPTIETGCLVEINNHELFEKCQGF